MPDNIAMINEQIYMSNRIFRLFCERYQMDSSNGNSLFNAYDIWSYIEQAYDMIHLNSDESAVSDISTLMIGRGAIL